MKNPLSGVLLLTWAEPLSHALERRQLMNEKDLWPPKMRLSRDRKTSAVHIP